jgi:hypothetical protein
MASGQSSAYDGQAAPRRRRFHLRHRLSFLLAVEVFAIFGLAPLIDVGLLPHMLLWSTFTLIMVAGAAMTDLRLWRGRLLVALVAVMLPIQLWRYIAPNDLVLVLHPLGLICFLVMLSWALSVSVFASERIRIDQLLGGVVLYLNIGLTFAVAYSLVAHLAPGAFVFPSPAPSAPVHPSYFTYFSFVTLTTVGYGDTIPVEPIARSLATLEAAMGQLYPAIILARLVSIEVSQRDLKELSKDRQQLAQDLRRATGNL